jgi:hypothetical protein
VRFTNQGLTLWYGAPDTPAPAGEGTPRRGASVTVAAQPPNPSNTVIVRYRVDQGPVQITRAVRRGTDAAEHTDYFVATFPDFWSGERVDYLPVLACSGRSSPDQTLATFPSSFRLAREPLTERFARSSSPDGTRPRGGKERDRLPYSLEYLASGHVPLQAPQNIGVTPEGILVIWYWSPRDGVMAGPKLNAKILSSPGADWMTIRRDGIGVMNVRATLETTDGALIYANYLGHFDLGTNGYQNFLDRRWPARAPTRTAPRFHTGHPNYQWLNRLQCIGIGEVTMSELSYTYDLYALR